MEHIKTHLSQYPKLSPAEALESFKHIELSDEETQEAILWGKQRKESQLKEAEKKLREEENRKFLTSTQWSFKQTGSYMLYRAGQIFEGKFKVDETNEVIFNLLCYYFSDDKQFLAYAENIGVAGPSLDKGIMLAGSFGVGKTWLMKLFAKNQRQVFHVINAKQIANEFEAEGENNQFVAKHKNAMNDSSSFFQPFAGICIDDMGTEDLKIHYGNRKNVIGDLIEQRYFIGNTGIFLHATTNLTAEQLKEFYGGRVVSRLREISNFIELPGNDRRK